MRVSIRVLFVAYCLFFLGRGTAIGFVPRNHADHDPEMLESIADKEIILSRFVRSEELLDDELDQFRNRVGGDWAIQRSPLTGTPHHVLGSGFDYASEVIGDESRAVELSRAFFGDFASFFQVDPGRLGEPWVEYHDGKWTVVFRETYEGIPVLGGRAHLVMTESGRVFAAGSDFHPDIEADVAGLIDAGDAVAIAKARFAYIDGNDFMREQPELFINPREGENGFSYRPTWKVILHMQSPFGGWESWIDANTGEVYARRDIYEYIDVEGTGRGDVENPTYCAGPGDRHFKDMNITLDGGTTVQTDDNGAFQIPHGGTDSVEVTARFRGTFFRQYNNGGGLARDTVAVLPGEPANIWFDDTNSHVSERDAWFHHWVVRDFIKGIDPDLTAADYQMPVTLNRTDGYCPGNAWWDGYGTNFCSQSLSWANTGRLGDVIYHEYGHGVNGFTYGGASFSGAQSEGNSDVITLLILKRPTLGIGFTANSCNNGIRSANQGFIYPDDLNDTIHNDGQAISSFFWEARNRMITTFGEAYTDSVLPRIWHFSRKTGKPSGLQDQVTWTFIYDDTDGNLNNGTPNFTELADAATEIGFSIPTITEGVQITHAGLPSTTDTLSSRTVTAEVVGLSSGIEESSVFLHYRVNDGLLTDLPMSPTANPDEYEAQIPAFPQGSQVEYYIEAADSGAHLNFSPTNAPDHAHWYDVVYLYDPCEGVGGWTLGDPSDDATRGIWINADPEGNNTRPGDDVTPDGDSCFVTANASNVKNGKTTLYSPFYPIGGVDETVVRYKRWYSNNYDATGVLATLDEWWNADVSADGGASWTPVENVNVGSEAWVDVEVELGALFGAVDSVQFRFVARDTGQATRVHAAVDEFRIVRPVATSIAAGSEEGASGSPGVFHLRGNRPNPFNPRTAIAFEIPARGRVSLDIFNVAGRKVKTLLAETRDAGRYEVIWNGYDDSGRAAASGIYFYQLRSGGANQTRKMLLVR